MGQHHVPLTIDRDGLVTNVGNPSEIYEICIKCGTQTTTLKTAHIDFRIGYVEGAGQLCRECYMGTSRNLFTIDERTILDTPNDSELGAKVRERYYETRPETKPIKSQFVCSICGEDTTNIDIEYLVGTNHLGCMLDNDKRIDSQHRID